MQDKKRVPLPRKNKFPTFVDGQLILMEPVLLKVRTLYRCTFDREAVMSLLRSRDNHVSWEGQQSFVEIVLRDPVVQKFPVLKQYRARLLKAYLDDVNRAFEEVNEDLLSSYLEVAHAAASRAVASLSPDHSSTPEICWRSYDIASSLIHISHRVDFSDVALAVWPAGLHLAAYFCSPPLPLRNLRVLELGAGVGLTGAAVALRGEASQLRLTDCSEEGLLLLRENLQANGVEEGLTKTQEGRCSVSVERLDWTEWRKMGPLGPLDVIFCADCWYDADALDAFIGVVEKAMQENPGCILYNCTAIRNPKTYEAYKNALTKMGCTATQETIPEHSFTGNDERYTIVLERFEKKNNH